MAPKTNVLDFGWILWIHSYDFDGVNYCKNYYAISDSTGNMIWNEGENPLLIFYPPENVFDYSEDALGNHAPVQNI